MLNPPLETDSFLLWLWSKPRHAFSILHHEIRSLFPLIFCFLKRLSIENAVWLLLKICVATIVFHLRKIPICSSRSFVWTRAENISVKVRFPDFKKERLQSTSWTEGRLDSTLFTHWTKLCGKGKNSIWNTALMWNTRNRLVETRSRFLRKDISCYDRVTLSLAINPKFSYLLSRGPSRAHSWRNTLFFYFECTHEVRKVRRASPI